MSLTTELEKHLGRRQQHGNMRQLYKSNELIDFASNDYLGLSRSPLLTSAVLKELEQLPRISLNGFGSTGSRLLTGNSAYAEELEEEIARYHGFKAGLLFNCGYMANLGLLSALAGSLDLIIYDSCIHASMHDGIRLSRAQACAFRHHDVAHLEQHLEMPCKGKRFVCIQSIYSIDGSQAPLEAVCNLCMKYGAHLILDEAHAVGLFGPRGAGMAAEKNLIKHVFAQVVTFGKALGCCGAIVLGSESLRRYLINFARPFIYTTALPLHALAAVKCAYKLLPTLENERIRLRELSDLFQKSPHDFASHIQAVKIRGNAVARVQSQLLAQAGFDVRPLMHPTVPRGEECLRICLHAFNTMSEVKNLIDHCKGERLPLSVRSVGSVVAKEP